MHTSLSPLFKDDIHQPFYFRKHGTAVLLIHGFPGTPAETRDVGSRLHEAGYSVRGMLLPGFGVDIDTLVDKKAADWIDAVVKEIDLLRKDHARVFLLGYSFGGSVAIHASQRADVNGLVLAAPFWRIGGQRQRWIWRVVRRIFPTFRPFRSLDFNNRQVSAGLSKMLPGIDLQDPDNQAALKQLRVPAGLVDEIIGLGASARALAPSVDTHTLFIQGKRDDVIAPKYTDELAGACNGTVQYIQVDQGHELLTPPYADFDKVVQTILDFIDPNREKTR